MTKLPLFLLAGLLAFGSTTNAAGSHPPRAHAPQLHPAYSVNAAPYAGRPNHAHAAPSFQWGWFGAESFSPTPQWHRGYYGAPMKWSSHRW